MGDEACSCAWAQCGRPGTGTTPVPCEAGGDQQPGRGQRAKRDGGESPWLSELGSQAMMLQTPGAKVSEKGLPLGHRGTPGPSATFPTVRAGVMAEGLGWGRGGRRKGTLAPWAQQNRPAVGWGGPVLLPPP